MTTLRITIEIDMDNPAVQGRWAWHVKNSLATLTRRIDSTDDQPDIWPHKSDVFPSGWTEQPITGKVHPRSNDRVTIGTFRVDQLDQTIPCTARVSS